jgi:hypothetical protein
LVPSGTRGEQIGERDTTGRQEWLAAARATLRPYFEQLDDANTRIVPLARTVRLYEPDPDQLERASVLMTAAAAGKHPKRAPLHARAEPDGTYTILRGKATHTILERRGVAAVPLILIIDRRGS